MQVHARDRAHRTDSRVTRSRTSSTPSSYQRNSRPWRGRAGRPRSRRATPTARSRPSRRERRRRAARAPRDAERAPELALVRPVDLDGVVRAGRAATTPQRIAVVAVHAGVDDHALARQRELEREQIAVRVARLVVRADRRSVAHR
jgi:hypothetical protein